jgi:hypothetical protein
MALLWARRIGTIKTPMPITNAEVSSISAAPVNRPRVRLHHDRPLASEHRTDVSAPAATRSVWTTSGTLVEIPIAPVLLSRVLHVCASPTRRRRSARTAVWLRSVTVALPSCGMAHTCLARADVETLRSRD